jgi:hypothetical protein
MAGFGNWARTTTPAMDLTRGNVALYRLTTEDGRIAEERWERFDGPPTRPESRLLSTETTLFDASGNQRQLTQTRWQHPDGPSAHPDQPYVQSSHTAVYDGSSRLVSTTDVQPHFSARDLSVHLATPTGELRPSAEDVQIPNSWQHRSFDTHGREISLTTWDDRLGTGSESLHHYRDGSVLTANFTLAHHQHGDPRDWDDAPQPHFLRPGAYIAEYAGFVTTTSSTQDFRGADNYHIHTATDGRRRTVDIDTADGTSHRTVIVDIRSDRVLHAEVTTTRPDHSRVRDTFDADGSGERTITSPKGATTHIAFDSHGSLVRSTPGLATTVTPQDVQERQAAFRSVQSPESKGHDSHLLPEDSYSRPCEPSVPVYSHDIADASGRDPQHQDANQLEAAESAPAKPTMADPEGAEFVAATSTTDADTLTTPAPHRQSVAGRDTSDDDDYDFG